MPDETEVDVVRTATSDPHLAERLASPSTTEGLYLEEASVFRPIATGDIFKDVPVPGSTEEEREYGLTMIIAHPSAMRRGAELEERVQAAPVVRVAGVRKSVWTPDRYDIFPLPLLAKVAARNGFDVPDLPWAADLRLCGPAESDSFDVRTRVACLSPEGVLLLLQRLVHTDTRAAVRIDTLQTTFGPKLDEIEELETWNEEIVAARSEAGAALAKELAASERAFDEFLSSVDPRLEVTIRSLFEDDLQRSEARRLIATELQRRLEE